MEVESPCIGVCKIDKKKKICIGCFRTINQISNWSKLSDSQKQKIVNDLK